MWRCVILCSLVLAAALAAPATDDLDDELLPTTTSPDTEEPIPVTEEPDVVWQFASFASTIAVMLGGYMVYLYFTQDGILYKPEQPPGMRRPSDIPAAAKLGSPSMRDPPLPFKTVYIKTSDGVRLHAWLIHAKDEQLRKKAPTLLYLHGNAGNMAFRLPNVDVLMRACENTVNVMMMDYRGYGESSGKPTEEGLGRDIDAVLKHLRHCGDVDPDNIFVFGRSLGGAVAVRGAVGEEAATIRGLILENTFSSISDMVDKLMPQLSWFKALVLRIHWPTKERLKSLAHLPALYFSGAKDALIPAKQMAENYLAHTAPKEHKRFVRIVTGGHNDTWQRGGWRYYEELFAFVKSHATPTAAALVHVPKKQWW